MSNDNIAEKELLLDPESMVEHLVKMKEMIEHPPFYLDQNREDLRSLFFHVSNLRNAILLKWEEKKYSEVDQAKKEEELEQDIKDYGSGQGDYDRGYDEE